LLAGGFRRFARKSLSSQLSHPVEHGLLCFAILAHRDRSIGLLLLAAFEPRGSLRLQFFWILESILFNPQSLSRDMATTPKPPPVPRRKNGKMGLPSPLAAISQPNGRNWTPSPRYSAAEIGLTPKHPDAGGVRPPHLVRGTKGAGSHCATEPVLAFLPPAPRALALA
jgi:hypothetical protein